MIDSKRRLAQLVFSLTPPVVRRAVGRVGNYLTTDIRGSIAFPSVELALKTLRTRGFSPGFCVDVGAFHGEWTKLLKTVFPSCRVLMVEPQEAKRSTLERVARELGPGVDYENTLLGAHDNQSVTFYEMDAGSSVFEETSPYPRVAVPKTARTLDGLLAARGSPSVDLLKLDVQGYELEVLRGAARALSQAEAILMETSLVPVNSGSPLFAEVIQFLAERGFQLFDFCSQVRRTDGVLWQTDLLFLRSNSRFAPKPELTHENWG